MEASTNLETLPAGLNPAESLAIPTRTLPVIAVTISPDDDSKQLSREPSGPLLDALGTAQGSNGTLLSATSDNADADAKSGSTALADESDVEFARSDSFDSDYELLHGHIWDSGKEAGEKGQFFGSPPKAGSASGHVLLASSLASASLPMEVGLETTDISRALGGSSNSASTPTNASRIPGSWPPLSHSAFWMNLPQSRPHLPDLRRYWKSFGGSDKSLD